MQIDNEVLLDEFYKVYHEQNYIQAVALLLLIQQTEHEPSFWINSRLSSCYYELKEYERAVHYGQLGYKLNPRSPLAIWDNAGALIMAKNERKGIALLLKLQAMDDDLTQYGFAKPDRKWMRSLKNDANFLIGKAYYTICNDDKAKEYLHRHLNQRRRGLRSIYTKKQVVKYLEKLR